MKKNVLIAAVLTVSACSSTPTASSDEIHTSSRSEESSDTHEHKKSVPGQHEHKHRHKHDAFSDAEEWTKVFDNPERDAWQRPDDVINAMQLKPNMTVADIGAGTGYFAVRLAKFVPDGQVIGTDIETDMVRFLNERTQKDGIKNVHAVLGTDSTSGLEPNSVDRVLVVNVWHHLSNRVEYAKHLAQTLKPGGKLFIVEFSDDAKRGPPATMRIKPDALIEELRAAGLTATVSATKLPEQYILAVSVQSEAAE